MLNKRFAFITIMLLAATIVAVGAAQVTGVNVPPGDIVDSPNANSGPQSPRVEVPNAPELPATSADVLFSDDFAAGNLDRWSSLEAGPSAATWVVKDDRLQQAGDATGNSADENAILIAKEIAFSDGTFEASVYNTSGSPVGLLFRGSEAGNYRLVIHTNTPSAAPKLLLEKVTSTDTQQIASAPVATWPGYTPGRWHNVVVSADGPAISVSIDGTSLITANDTTHNSGWVGVWSFADMSAQFDNVRIQHTTGR